MDFVYNRSQKHFCYTTVCFQMLNVNFLFIVPSILHMLANTAQINEINRMRKMIHKCIKQKVNKASINLQRRESPSILGQSKLPQVPYLLML